MEIFFGKAYLFKQKKSSSANGENGNEKDSEFCQLFDNDSVTEHYVSSERFKWKQLFDYFFFCI